MIVDLFGDAVTTPGSKPLKTAGNASQGFPEWWATWPKHPRKADKQKCLNYWSRFALADCGERVLQHTRFMLEQDDWLKESGTYIPAPIVYLRRAGWIDWEPSLVTRQLVDTLAILKAHKGAPMPASVREKLAQIRGRA